MSMGQREKSAFPTGIEPMTSSPGVQEVMGQIPVAQGLFFSLSNACDMLIESPFTFNYQAYNSL